MLTLKRLETICAAARSKGAPDSTEVKFCAGVVGVPANSKTEMNVAANFRAGTYLENPQEEVVIEAPVLELNQ